MKAYKKRLAQFSASILMVASIAASANNTKFIQSAIDHPNRMEYDIERDSQRKPAQVLEFFDIRPGMTVLDVFSGSGYYTELLSYVVGPKGTVIAHNNQAYLNYLEKKLKLRYTDGRLPNVKRITAEANELSLPENSIDTTFLILAYHDIYYRPKKKTSWPQIDRVDFLRRLYLSLKPGGILAIIDHHAESGSPTSTGHDLHRIAVETVIQQVSESGFKLMERAYFLENATDDLAKHMYAPELRGKTSRFVLKFIKPLNIEKHLVDDRIIP
ncbi:class I SAM-dependent methyltransferase [Pleionea sediminis]|uniref:class I SAM-dependent methyltransferase n=1 Tax=Pleionea sediminis TaxID=2569479 RepID=UPI00197B565F|nr:methyltransferase domain-containing protein [Pleionea sediminis]